MAKTGPKRRMGVNRLKNGHIKRADYQKQEPADIVALEARMRQLWGVERYLELKGNPAAMEAARKTLNEQDLGSALGRLRKAGPGEGISKTQYEAAGYFGWLYREFWTRKHGSPPPNPRALDYGAAPSGISTHPEDSDEYIADIERKFRACHGAILSVGSRMCNVFEAMKRLLVEDIMPTEDEIGDIRLALNAIDRARGG